MRRLRLIAASLAVALALSSSFGAATRLVLLASAAQTATANGASIPVPNLKELDVYVDVTAVSGSTPTLTMFLQSSSDGGTTWHDEPFTHALIDQSSSATEGTTRINNRNIMSAAVTTGKWVAHYNTFGDMVRIRWVIGGTTPSFTMSVRATGK